mgnify:CR=1 FL=1
MRILALAAQPADTGDTAAKNFVVGVEMTEKELQAAFERNGLKRIDPAKGDKFDPHLHQAMMEQPGSDVAPGCVIQVFQPGYELLGRLNAVNKTITESPVSPKQLAGLLALVQKGTISGKVAKDVFTEMFDNGGEAETIVKSKGLVQVGDAARKIDPQRHIVSAVENTAWWANK